MMTEVVVHLESVIVPISESDLEEYNSTGFIPFHLMYRARASLKKMQDNGEGFIESLEEL